MRKLFKNPSSDRLFPWDKPFTQEVLHVAIPVVIQASFAALLNIVDNIMIGKLGEAELAGVSQANRITFLFQLALFGLSGGTATFVAQYWGKKDMHGIRSVMGLSLCISLLVALLFLLPSLFMPRTLLQLLLNDDVAIEYACQYLSIIAFSFVTFSIIQTFSTVLRSTEQARLPMAASIMALFTNTFLNYCLIYGNLGFPKLGVRGGALATLIATCVELLIVVIASYAWKLPTAARIKELLPRSLAFMKKYAVIALPVMMNEVLWSLGIVIQSAVYGQMGTSTVAAISIYNAVEQIAIVAMRGVTTAAAVIIGKRIGAGNEGGAYHTAGRMLFIAIPSGLIAGCITVLVSMLPLSSLFSVSAETLQYAKTLLQVSAACMWMFQLCGLLIVGIMRAGGDVQFSLWVDIGPLWLIGLPITVLAGLVLKLSIPWVYLLAQADSVVKVVLGFKRYKSKKWIHNLVK